MSKLNQFLTTNEAAERLRLSPRTLERFRLDGTGPRWCRVGRRRVIYSAADIDVWTASRTFTSTSEADTAGVS